MANGTTGADDTGVSPTTENTDAALTAASSSGPDAITPAVSSTGTDTSTSNDQPKSMADAIAQAFDAATKPETNPGDNGDATDDGAGDDDPAREKSGDTDATKPTGDEPGSDATAKEDADAEPSKEELAAMNPKQRRRVEQLLDQRRGMRAEITELQPDAHSYRTLRSFMAREDLTDANVVELLQFGADLRSGDPKRLQKFVDRVTPLVRMALEATGQAVPQDLTGRVESGELTEEMAREHARLRHERDLAAQRAQRATAQTDTVVTEQTRTAIQQAVGNWHTQTAQSDPDFALKLDVMKRTAQALVAERGHPRTPQDAVEYAQAAYAEATTFLRRMQPQKAPTRPTPNGTPSANRSGVKPVPTSLEEAMSRAFDAATRG